MWLWIHTYLSKFLQCETVAHIFVIQHYQCRQLTSSTSEWPVLLLYRPLMRSRLHRHLLLHLATACHQCRCSVLQLEWFRCRLDQVDPEGLHLRHHAWADRRLDARSHRVCMTALLDVLDPNINCYNSIKKIGLFLQSTVITQNAGWG